MDFSLTPEQQKLYDEVARMAREQLNDGVGEDDRAGRFDRAKWDRVAGMGILGACLPKSLGGEGHDVVTAVALAEALGYGCEDNGLTLAVNGQMWAVQEPIQRFGSEAQKSRYLPPLASGRMLGAHAMTERGSGSDTYSLSTVAEPDGDGYVLNGSKTYIGMAPVCDVALVFANTNPDLGQWGISAFLVDSDTPGFTRHPATEKMGLRTVPMGDLTFEDCRIPGGSLLGPEGAGVGIFTDSMTWERSFIFASHVGAMARQLDDAVSYARSRVQFGQPIGKFQSVSNRIADMRLRLETSRLLLYKAAWLKARGEGAQLESAMANLHIAESFLASSLDSVRIHGGVGYVTEGGVERSVRDSMGGVIYSGTSDIQRQLIARTLGI